MGMGGCGASQPDRENGRMPDLYFRSDLYQGAARDYDRYRTPYPRSLIDDLAERTTSPTSNGSLLDLACGTGQLSFELCDRFAEVWAVDQEPGMIEVVKEKAAAAGVGNVRAVASAAQDLRVADGSFDLVAVGNAFHRLPRAAAATLIAGWLRPGGYLALVWGGDPCGPDGEAPWQRAVAAVRGRWMAEVGQRIPAEYEEDRAARPDEVILAKAGFELAGRREFTARRDWTADELAGHAFSTSVLSRAALGGRASEFEADLRRALAAIEPSGRVRQTVNFAYDLARRPE
jgi:SAM-dependent methyltransferase